MPHTGVTYKGFVLLPVVAPDDQMYAAMLVIRAPDGVQRSTGVLGDFPCPLEARRFALSYGMAEIDHRTIPLPEWVPQRGHRVEFDMAAAA
ncbi:hypothetical protein AWB68_07779 [Caballeronia choica]|uniref:Uncharacterized protein n=1 Tax=Caballeronia choica TaxID=326476 RepID=A0A158KX23_9BURK|nr:hypothetical protein [Caballeronia choica]SAL85718.1 hypothetical protein AWB68_07779 [Caballeronia choica]